MAIEDPLCPFPEIGVRTTQQAHQLAKVEDGGLWCCHDVHVFVEQITRVQPPPLVREELEAFALLTAIRTLHGHQPELFVAVVAVCTEQVL